jgi:osmotically-inducible protein OsmY
MNSFSRLWMSSRNPSEKRGLGSLILWLPCAILLLSTTGCVPALFGAGVGVTSKMVGDDRRVGAVIDDTVLHARIRRSFLDHSPVVSVFRDVDVAVREGRILLTGQVKQPQDRVDLMRLVWDQEGVREVINEVSVANESEETGGHGVMKDHWITTQIKARLLFEKHLHSMNYSIETVRGIVYIFGMAVTQEEMDRVIRIIGNIPGVQKIVNHARLRDSTMRRQAATESSYHRDHQGGDGDSHLSPARSPSVHNPSASMDEHEGVPATIRPRSPHASVHEPAYHGHDGANVLPADPPLRKSTGFRAPASSSPEALPTSKVGKGRVSGPAVSEDYGTEERVPVMIDPLD